MGDQSGGSDAGWHPDPDRRHEFRYRDENGWTDQVADGGVTATDPPGPAPAGSAPPYVPPTESTPTRKLPIGLLALIGAVVAAVVVGLVVLLGGGDDDGGGGGGEDASGEDATGEFSGTISEEEPFVVRQVDLDAGDALRVVVEPDEDLDSAVTLGLSIDLATTEAFGSRSFEGSAVDEEDILDAYAIPYENLFEDAVDADLSAELATALSDDFSDLQSELSDEVPSLADAGVPFAADDLGQEGEPDGIIFVAPIEGTYSVIVSSQDSSGDFDGKIEVGDPVEDFEAFDPDEPISALEYIETFGDQADYLCDEDFWGGDPTEISFNAENFCDEDAYDQLLSAVSPSSDSSDSSDFSDDFSDDVSDDLPAGEAQDPTVAIDEYGSDPNFDGLADDCFVGDHAACDDLWRDTPVGGFGSYENYGASCGYRVEEEIPGQCEATLG